MVAEIIIIDYDFSNKIDVTDNINIFIFFWLFPCLCDGEYFDGFSDKCKTKQGKKKKKKNLSI